LRKDARERMPAPAEPHETDEPARPRADVIKATIYLSRETMIKLEEIRLARLRQGQKIGRSALIEEAIALLKS
jgi:hypothetical protein